jgi:hypothetical protein
MEELGWSMSEATQENLQNLMSQRYMTMVELVTCRVPKDPASLVPTGVYIVACMAFYKREFCVPSHQFLHSLLQFYGLELHHLTPLGILHMETFVTPVQGLYGD